MNRAFTVILTYLDVALMDINAYLRELEALMKAVSQDISVLLSPSECDGGHTTIGHGGAYTVLFGQR